MRERPILFSAPMVRACLRTKNPKTQTRRIVTGTPLEWLQSPTSFGPEFVADQSNGLSPYGYAGDRLYGRETFRLDVTYNGLKPAEVNKGAAVFYVADGFKAGDGVPGKTRVSIHMPRWASRLTLDLTEVRIERLQDITEADATAEGVERIGAEFGAGERPTSFDDGPNFWTVDTGFGSLNSPTAAGAYSMLWEHINGPDTWAENPWVWVLTFPPVQS